MYSLRLRQRGPFWRRPKELGPETICAWNSIREGSNHVADFFAVPRPSQSLHEPVLTDLNRVYNYRLKGNLLLTDVEVPVFSKTNGSQIEVKLSSLRAESSELLEFCTLSIVQNSKNSYVKERFRGRICFRLQVRGDSVDPRSKIQYLDLFVICQIAPEDGLHIGRNM
jgi:hypothetical protein